MSRWHSFTLILTKFMLINLIKMIWCRVLLCRRMDYVKVCCLTMTETQTAQHEQFLNDKHASETERGKIIPKEWEINDLETWHTTFIFFNEYINSSSLNFAEHFFLGKWKQLPNEGDLEIRDEKLRHFVMHSLFLSCDRPELVL